MTVKAAEQAQERGPRLIMVLESTTEPLQWTRALSLPQPERRSGRKRCVAGNDLPTMRMQRRRQRRKSAEGESTEDNDSNPDQKIQDGLKRLPKLRWTKEQKGLGYFYLSSRRNRTGVKCRDNLKSGLVSLDHETHSSKS